MQKQFNLNSESFSKISPEEMFEIFNDFVVFEDGRKNLNLAYEFEDELPWRKKDISFAIIQLVLFMCGKEDLPIKKIFPEEKKDAFISILVSKLNDLEKYIPNPKQYEEIIEIKKVLDSANKN